MKLTNPNLNRRLSLEEIEASLLYTHDYPQNVVEDLMPKISEINRIRDEKNAIILAHYYQTPPIQLIADIKGDSLKLAQEAKKLRKENNLIVSSTVRFMAEMVKILNQGKKVVIPDYDAGCSIAEGINGKSVLRMREEFPSCAIVAYINTYADVKAQVDSVCTSANAKEVLKNIVGNPVILLPDYFFSCNIINEMLKESYDPRTFLAYKGKELSTLVLEDVNSKEQHRLHVDDYSALPLLDKGTCIVHEQFTPQEIKYLRKKDGIELVIAHPEVNPNILKEVDFVGGTGNMISFVNESKATKYLVISECDLTAPLRDTFPDKEFYTPCKLCPYMKKNSVDNLLTSIRDEVYEINLDPKTSEGARRSLENMFALTNVNGGLRK